MLFGPLQVPEQFKTNAHKKIAGCPSSYCENATRREKQKAGCRRGSSSRCDKAQTAWLSIHNVTANAPLMLQSTEHSRHTASTLRPWLRLEPCVKNEGLSFIWMRPVLQHSGVANAEGYAKKQTGKNKAGLPSKKLEQGHNATSSGKALRWPIKYVQAYIASRTLFSTTHRCAVLALYTTTTDLKCNNRDATEVQTLGFNSRGWTKISPAAFNTLCTIFRGSNLLEQNNIITNKVFIFNQKQDSGSIAWY